MGQIFCEALNDIKCFQVSPNRILGSGSWRNKLSDGRVREEFQMKGIVSIFETDTGQVPTRALFLGMSP